MSLMDNNIGRIILGLMPPAIFWAIIISLVGGLVMWLIKFASFPVGMLLTGIAFYLCVTLYVMGRQLYWFIAKKGDYSKGKK